MPSSYFSPPANHLDPALFDGWKLKDSVREPLITAALSELHKAGLKDSGKWLRMWITGSAISYQWNADRGNGDLDVQIGIMYEQFLNSNPEYRNISEYIMNEQVNTFLRDNLWPKMSHANIGGKIFEVTYFWNYDVESDIMSIRPYAAYDLMSDQWIVQPPELPVDPKTLYPEEWYALIENDDYSSYRITSVYNDASKEISGYKPGSAAYINAKSRMNLAEAQAKTLYDDIHEGRRQAFTMGGKGYSDYHNFRWQSAKASGTIERLKSIIQEHKTEFLSKQTELYGSPIKSADEALEDAMNFRLGKRYAS